MNVLSDQICYGIAVSHLSIPRCVIDLVLARAGVLSVPR